MSTPVRAIELLLQAIRPFATFTSSIDDVIEKVGLGADGLVGGAYYDTTFWNAAGQLKHHQVHLNNPY